MPVAVDITGKKFARLTAVARVKGRGWRLQCKCGNEIVSQVGPVNAGKIKSCGCLRSEVEKGLSSHALYVRWAGMIQRCENPNHVAYPRYGGKGVKVCERWHKFEHFLADMGEAPEGMTLDRFPNSEGDYEPSNCRWATPGEQNRNTERNVWVTVGGETLTTRDWEIRKGVNKGAFQRRVNLGWPLEKVVTEPIQPGKALERRV